MPAPAEHNPWFCAVPGLTGPFFRTVKVAAARRRPGQRNLRRWVLIDRRWQ